MNSSSIKTRDDNAVLMPDCSLVGPSVGDPAKLCSNSWLMETGISERDIIFSHKICGDLLHSNKQLRHTLKSCGSLIWNFFTSFFPSRIHLSMLDIHPSTYRQTANRISLHLCNAPNNDNTEHFCAKHHSSFPTTLWNYPHFINGKTKAHKEINAFAKSQNKLVISRVTIQPWQHLCGAHVSTSTPTT